MQGSNSTISSYRIEASGGKEQYGTTPILEGVQCYIEPPELDPQSAFNDEATFYDFMLYIDGINDFKISDKIVDDLGDIYLVKAVQNFRGGDVPSHQELKLTKKRDDYI